MTTQQLKGWRVKPEDMPEWCAVLKTELIQLRTENERLTRECQKLVGFKVEAPRLLDEIERLKAELDKRKEQCRLLTVRLNDGDKAFQNSQAEIERLKGEVERWKESAISDDEEFKKTIVDLAHHKQLLVERDRVLGVALEALFVARCKFRRLHSANVDDLGSLPTPYDDALSQINKVLEGK